MMHKANLTVRRRFNWQTGLMHSDTSGENDADEATLGPVYTDAGIQVNVWAPTAQAVSLKLFNEAKIETARLSHGA
ncbi:hypothetical protein P4S73_03460 [Paraglaciecola sp. Hal342]